VLYEYVLINRLLTAGKSTLNLLLSIAEGRMNEVGEFFELVGIGLNQANLIVISLNGQHCFLACTYFRQLFSYKLNGV
jgi:hypothetical protein